jgi:hypothetical protein
MGNSRLKEVGLGKKEEATPVLGFRRVGLDIREEKRRE